MTESICISQDTAEKAASAVWKEYRRLSKDARVSREVVGEWREASEELTELMRELGEG